MLLSLHKRNPGIGHDTNAAWRLRELHQPPAQLSALLQLELFAKDVDNNIAGFRPAAAHHGLCQGA
jgi:hypothetical protein